jgi:hypothetical protein
MGVVAGEGRSDTGYKQERPARQIDMSALCRFRARMRSVPFRMLSDAAVLDQNSAPFRAFWPHQLVVFQ